MVCNSCVYSFDEDMANCGCAAALAAAAARVAAAARAAAIRAGGNQAAQMPGLGLAKRPAFSDDTTTPPWWTTMTPEEANAAIAAAAKVTLAAMQAAQASSLSLDGKAKKEAEAKAKEEAKAKKPSFTPLHALSFTMAINDEAAAQGDNGWTGWVAEPRGPTRKMVVSPAYLAPLSLSSYEQFRASRGRPMVYNEQSKRHVMLLPGAKPVGNVTVVSPSGEVVNMDAKAFAEWEQAQALPAVVAIPVVEEAEVGLVRTMGVSQEEDDFGLVRTMGVSQEDDDLNL